MLALKLALASQKNQLFYFFKNFNVISTTECYYTQWIICDVLEITLLWKYISSVYAVGHIKK